MAREAMLGKMAESNLCRISDHNKAFESTDVAAGDWVIFYKQISRKSIPKWRGPAIILAVWWRGRGGPISEPNLQDRAFSRSQTSGDFAGESREG